MLLLQPIVMENKTLAFFNDRIYSNTIFETL